jgi:hypothetical protein
MADFIDNVMHDVINDVINYNDVIDVHIRSKQTQKAYFF